MIKLAPSLLAADCANLEAEIKRVENVADMLHIDVMDGHFVPNLSFGVPIVAAIKRVAECPLDVHLMITDPKFYVKSFKDAGADIITFHLEAVDDPGEVIEEIKRHNIKCGIALKPRSRFELVEPFIGRVDMVLQMLVEPGFGGQKMDEYAIGNLRRIRQYNKDVDIQVDGGITAQNVRDVFAAGANVIVAGTAIFGGNDAALACVRIRENCENASGI